MSENDTKLLRESLAQVEDEMKSLQLSHKREMRKKQKEVELLIKEYVVVHPSDRRCERLHHNEHVLELKCKELTLAKASRKDKRSSNIRSQTPPNSRHPPRSQPSPRTLKTSSSHTPKTHMRTRSRTPPKRFDPTAYAEDRKKRLEELRGRKASREMQMRSRSSSNSSQHNRGRAPRSSPSPSDRRRPRTRSTSRDPSYASLTDSAKRKLVQNPSPAKRTPKSVPRSYSKPPLLNGSLSKKKSSLSVEKEKEPQWRPKLSREGKKGVEWGDGGRDDSWAKRSNSLPIREKLEKLIAVSDSEEELATNQLPESDDETYKIHPISNPDTLRAKAKEKVKREFDDSDEEMLNQKLYTLKEFLKKRKKG